MILFSISLIFLLLHIIFHKSAKANNILVVLAFLFICSVYAILAANSTKANYFFPQKQLKVYSFTGNYYNWLTFNLTKFKLDLGVDKNFVTYLTDGIEKDLLKTNKVDASVKMFYDTSIYKNKVYLYFGITPIILFYLPFYLITGYFISDHIVVLILSIFIFLLHILIYRKILSLLRKQNYFTVVPILIFGLTSGIALTYISITIHLIPILTSVCCSLAALYIFLLLLDNRYKNLKMFLIGLFLALAVGARPISIILTVFLIFAVFYIDNFNIKKNIKQYCCCFIPLIIYGIILALYNYLRFDSIFDFGFKYQFSPNYMLDISKNFSFIIQHFFYNLFYFPKFIGINPYVIFNNAAINNFEPVVGGVIIFPIIISLICLSKFSIFEKNKKTFLFLIVMIITSFIYLLVDSYKGSNARFVTEYLFLLLVPGVISFYFIIESINNIKLKNILKILFFIFVVFSLYINTNLINSIILMSKNGFI